VKGRAAIVLASALAAVAAAAPTAAAAGRPADAPRRITVLAQEGRAAVAAAQLRKGALRVVRRRGRQLEVVASPRRVPALARLPGVASAGEAPVALADEVTSEGLARTGAGAVLEAAGGGQGLTIAILDLGFGSAIAARQAAGELPPPSRLELVAFDPVSGIRGTNAYGNPTNHGELVAQTVYDYAPRARYVFVSYHTQADFLAATDWLVARRPDIVVHSNSFIEGSFDGTGPEARAVDRAAAAGILWFNSAGNYALNHWSGPWSDADGDGALDLGNGGAFVRAAGSPITFALSWATPPGGAPPDLDLVLDQRLEDGTWTAVRSSTDAQAAGAPPSERIVGYVAPVSSEYRIRVVRAGGPDPVGPLTIFSREIPLAGFGGSPRASIPTPGDAAGSVTVGAVDWRGNLLKAYSSQGPTLDGRLKPDLVAPTNTRVLGPSGPRAVGGTSIAAPNAAGVAAVLLAAQRRAGIPVDAALLRASLASTALDLGEAGPDHSFGAGRVRAEIDPPELSLTEPIQGTPLRGVVRVRPRIDDASPLARWTVVVDGVRVAERRGRAGTVRLDTRALADGAHAITLQALDLPGNAVDATYPFAVDNTRPLLRLRRVELSRRDGRGGRTASERARGRQGTPRRPLRTIRAVVLARDAGRRPMRLALEVRSGGRILVRRALVLRSTLARRVSAGRLPRGRYRLELTLVDAAGNVARAQRVLVVR
jgi:hypothetical protein